MRQQYHDGPPIRASLREGEPGYDPSSYQFEITVDGRRPAFAFAFDRAEGWVMQETYERSRQWADEPDGEWNEFDGYGAYLGDRKLTGDVEVRRA